MKFVPEVKAHKFVNNVGFLNQLGTSVLAASSQFVTQEIVESLVICVFKQIQSFAHNASDFAGIVGHGIAPNVVVNALSCKNKTAKKKKVKFRWQGSA